MGLLQLPSEILIIVLLNSKLDVRDAFAVQQVNHYFHDLYKTSIHLQYDLECKVAQVMDNPNCTLPVRQRLQMLRDQETAWRSLVPALTKSISASREGDCWKYRIERSDLLFIRHRFGPNSSDPIVKSLSTQGLVDGDPEADHSRFITRVKEANLLSSCIAEHDLFSTLGWTSNPNHHDMLHELQVHLFEYSTGKAHPRAEKPSITLYRVPEGMEIDDDAAISMAMEVFGENLVVSNNASSYEFNGKTAFLYIYNWKTGEVKCEPMPLSNTGIIVLDHDLILIPDNKTWSLLIYHIPPSSTGEPVKLIKRLDLPPLRSSVSLDPHDTRCWCAPNPTGGGHFPEHVPPSLPFITRWGSAIAIFKWSIDGNPTEMIVHRNSLVNLLPARDEWSTIINPSTIPWDAWGPSVALWKKSRSRFSGPPSTNGQRTVGIPPIAEHHTNSTLRLKDFNKYNVRRFQEKKQQNHSTFKNRSFLHPIISHLPFLEITSPALPTYDRVCITDGLIVGIKEYPGPIELLIYR